MGGTFNPIHRAHLEMARQAYSQAGLDVVWFMPSKRPPHKDARDILPEQQRGDMVQLAIRDYPYFLFSDYEFRRSETTYSADTLYSLSCDYPEDSFYFIMGGDSFFELENWYHPEEIMRLAKLLVVGRDGVSVQDMERRAAQLCEQYGAQIQLIYMREMRISSSRIRDKIACGEDVSGDVGMPVWQYIKKYHLYDTRYRRS